MPIPSLRPRLAWVALTALAALLLPGCAAGEDSLRKELSELRADVLKMRADQGALQTRLAALETARPEPRREAAAPKPDDRPELAVVRLTPDAEGAEPTGALPPTSVEALLAAAEEAPAKKSCDAVVPKLRAFLAADGEHPVADVVTYLLGECLFAKGELPGARDAFEGVAKFAYGTRTPDALSRLVEIHTKLGDRAKAEKVKETLLATYPSSEAASKWKRK